MSSPGKDEFIFFEASKQHLKPKRVHETVKKVGQLTRKEIQEANWDKVWKSKDTRACEASFNDNPAI